MNPHSAVRPLLVAAVFGAGAAVGHYTAPRAETLPTVTACPDTRRGQPLIASRITIENRKVTVECTHWPAKAGEPLQRGAP